MRGTGAGLRHRPAAAAARPGVVDRDARQPAEIDLGAAERAQRMQMAADFIDDPRVAVTGFEAQIGTRYTLDTISWLAARRQGVRASSG